MDGEIRNKILDLVHSRPRAISEIADTIKKNWRTADKYISQLCSEDLIKVHVFRKGSQGALKVVYWSASIHSGPSGIKNFLLQRILNGVKKDDFSALDIVQNVSETKRKVEYYNKENYGGEKNVKNFLKALGQAETKMLLFSGNLSFMNLGGEYDLILNTLEKRLEQGVNIFILTRVDVSNLKIINALLQFNNKNYQGKIEIRYAYQPLRCTVIDEKEVYLKENFQGSNFNKDDALINEGTYIYTLTDLNWISWMIDVFWEIWRGSISAEKRIQVLKDIKFRN